MAVSATTTDGIGWITLDRPPANSYDGAFVDVDPAYGPREGRGNLGGGLVGDDLDQRSVFLDRVALLDQPAIDLGFGDPFTQVGKLEVRHQKSSTSWARTKMRSTDGR
jgi:hypothetical protein